MDKSNISVCIIEGNCFLREGIKSYLEKTRYQVHASFPSILDLVKEKSRRKNNNEECCCELVIIGMDSNHNPKNVENILKTIKSELPDARIVILSSTLDEDLILDFSNYADGYILKDISAAAMMGSLDLIMLGEKVFPTSMVELISKTHHQWENTENKNNGAEIHCLSSREIDIIKHLANGEPNKVIANHLSISDSTVKVHLKAILRKLGVSNRTQAALWAVNHGLIEAPIKTEPSHSLTNYNEEDQKTA